jgi:hypothetical protein
MKSINVFNDSNDDLYIRINKTRSIPPILKKGLNNNINIDSDVVYIEIGKYINSQEKELFWTGYIPTNIENDIVIKNRNVYYDNHALPNLLVLKDCNNGNNNTISFPNSLILIIILIIFIIVLYFVSRKRK